MITRITKLVYKPSRIKSEEIRVGSSYVDGYGEEYILSKQNRLMFLTHCSSGAEISMSLSAFYKLFDCTEETRRFIAGLKEADELFRKIRKELSPDMVKEDLIPGQKYKFKHEYTLDWVDDKYVCFLDEGQCPWRLDKKNPWDNKPFQYHLQFVLENFRKV